MHQLDTRQDPGSGAPSSSPRESRSQPIDHLDDHVRFEVALVTVQMRDGVNPGITLRTRQGVTLRTHLSPSGTKTCRERRKVVVMVGGRYRGQTWQRRQRAKDGEDLAAYVSR